MFESDLYFLFPHPLERLSQSVLINIPDYLMEVSTNQSPRKLPVMLKKMMNPTTMWRYHFIGSSGYSSKDKNDVLTNSLIFLSKPIFLRWVFILRNKVFLGDLIKHFKRLKTKVQKSSNTLKAMLRIRIRWIRKILAFWILTRKNMRIHGSRSKG